MDDDIINFTRSVWRTYFPDNRKAPKTLCYDPLSLCSGTISGLSHIAHDSIYMNRSGRDYDPDGQIYNIDPEYRAKYPAGPNDLTTADISNLQQLEWILFVSCDSMIHSEQVLEKLMPQGVVIVINECVKLSKEWRPLEVPVGTPFGKTTSYKMPSSENAHNSESELKSILAFMLFPPGL
jgi:hypothetical protein